MERRTAGTIVSLVGISLVVYVLSIHLFGATGAWERLSSNTRPVFTEQALTQARADVNGLKTVGDEFTTKGLPAIATALNLTPQQTSQLFAAQFPATATAIVALPETTARLDAQVSLLEREQARYQRVDATPSSSVTSTAIPWFMLIVGVLALLAGLAMQTRSTYIPGVAALLGVVMIAVPLVFSLPSKAVAADRLNDNIAPVFSTQAIATARADINGLTAMTHELQAKLVPVLAAALKVSPEQAGAFVTRSLPALAAGLEQIPAGLQRFTRLTAIAELNVTEYNDVAAVNYTPVPWVTVGAGIITGSVSLWALAMTPMAAEARETRRTSRRQRRAA